MYILRLYFPVASVFTKVEEYNINKVNLSYKSPATVEEGGVKALFGFGRGENELDPNSTWKFDFWIIQT